jgi:hypothetical protein
MPTTPGGLPSGCAVLPVAPPPGCATGQIDSLFSVLACAQPVSDGTDFSITLTPEARGLAGDGDELELTIQTPAGNTLVETRANVQRTDTDGYTRCQGRFDLDGTPIDDR